MASMDYMGYIISFFILVAALFGYFISFSRGRKRTTDRIVMIFSIVVVLGLAVYSWSLVDGAVRSHRARVIALDRRANAALAVTDSLRSAFDRLEGISMALSLALDEGFAERESLRATIDELSAKLDSVKLNYRPRHSQDSDLDEFRPVKEQHFEMAVAEPSPPPRLPAKPQKKLAFTVSVVDSFAPFIYTYYTFYSDPPGDLEGVSIYFKFDRPFLELYDLSEESVRHRRSEFIVEAGDMGFYYRSSALFEGETIVICAAGRRAVLPRTSEPPVLSP